MVEIIDVVFAWAIVPPTDVALALFGRLATVTISPMSIAPKRDVFARGEERGESTEAKRCGRRSGRSRLADLPQIGPRYLPGG